MLESRQRGQSVRSGCAMLMHACRPRPTMAFLGAASGTAAGGGVLRVAARPARGARPSSAPGTGGGWRCAEGCCESGAVGAANFCTPARWRAAVCRGWLRGRRARRDQLLHPGMVAGGGAPRVAARATRKVRPTSAPGTGWSATGEGAAPPRSARPAFAAATGGGRCNTADCDNMAAGGAAAGLCVRHSGNSGGVARKKCNFRTPSALAAGTTNFCGGHGGGPRCNTADCSNIVRHTSGLCRKHRHPLE